MPLRQPCIKIKKKGNIKLTIWQKLLFHFRFQNYLTLKQ